MTGKIGRLGIGVKAKVEAWESEVTKVSILKGKYVEKPAKVYIDPDNEFYKRSREAGSNKNDVLKEIEAWASDHLGITVGLRVRCREINQTHE